MNNLALVPNVIPIHSREMTKDRLKSAVGKVLANVGFQNLDVNQVAHEAGLDRKLIYQYFGGLQGLVYEYGQTQDFWPDVEELLGDEQDVISSLPPHEVMALFFKRYMHAILKRPYTLEILAWEAIERNALTKTLEEIRSKTALQFFEYMEQDPPKNVDLTALVLLMAGAINFIVVRSRIYPSLGGIDLRADEGWKRLERTIDQLLSGILK
ncbi:TetR/AcrR family transcriptional regulator [Pseudodesulfovibrio piezophilus]|uniref:Transcriptional regulator, TetR family n=1 Tax=Pseudodesulfovibrio piezophilus (strain DSM 21447 / JCM 15486 / C1TLV30) TaxID=1322246 RepID=M1WQ72_PSEP2|nr:TetR/AcrR family transcriptional regulator [Pseudodesulfovibrio piezophilus]CCH47532.1 Transcriptional regulator, TetR family [Pseudodesulfovibrio piezophilus C1TLV30]